MSFFSEAGVVWDPGSDGLYCPFLRVARQPGRPEESQWLHEPSCLTAMATEITEKILYGRGPSVSLPLVSSDTYSSWCQDCFHTAPKFHNVSKTSR